MAGVVVVAAEVAVVVSGAVLDAMGSVVDPVGAGGTTAMGSISVDMAEEPQDEETNKTRRRQRGAQDSSKKGDTCSWDIQQVHILHTEPADV